MGLHGVTRLSRLRLFALAGLAGLAAAALVLRSAPAEAQARLTRGPLVVELFTAQGCASCPQANQMLDGIAERDRVIALTFPVDYWDYLGWRDTFGRPEFSARQRAYAPQLGLKEIYTPEVVVNGRREAPGVDAAAIERLVESEATRRTSLRRPQISLHRRGERLTVGAGSPFQEPADVWLVRYDPNRRDVRVRTGENQGKVVPHHNVVRELVRLGAWNGRQRNYDLPAGPPTLRRVILVQGAKGGPILAARDFEPPTAPTK